VCAWGVLRELGYEVEALHVEHGLGGAEGLADAMHCAGLGATVVAVDVAAGPNLEARAREARYAAAREHAEGRPIVTGHTLSDQAETVLYRLVSSSGARAISAMRPGAGGIARPLLCVTAAETRAWCAEQGVETREDATNTDTRLRRNLIRHEVMPALRRVHPGAEVNLARSAELLGELDELLRELAGSHVEPRIDLASLDDLPRALRVLVLREAAEQAAGRPLRLPRALTAKLEAVAARRSGIERLSLGRDLEAVRDRATLAFVPPGTRYPPPR
jgi:tRNA(Ile)-lysidine synthase